MSDIETNSAIIVDPDTLTLTVGGSAVTISETATALLWLGSRGMHTDEAVEFLGKDGVEAAAELARCQLDLQKQLNLSFNGHAKTRAAPEPRTVAGQLCNRATKTPTAEVLLIEMKDGLPISITAAELMELVDDVADRLSGMGLGPGKHVAVDATPSLEHIALCLAAWEVGLSTIILRPSLSQESLTLVQKVFNPALWFVGTEFTLPSNASIIHTTPENNDLGDWLEDGPRNGIRPKADPDREAAVIMSSGSTGEPKLLALSQRGLTHSAEFFARSETPTAEERVSASIDMSAISGLRIFAVLPACSACSTFVPLPQTRASSLGFFAALGEQKVAHARLIPANLRAVAQFDRTRVNTLGLEHLRILTCGGSASSSATLRHVRDQIGVMVLDSYGMTETSGSFCSTQTETMTSTGAQPVHLLTRLVDDDGQPCPVGEIGHIRVFDAALFLGQYTVTGLTLRKAGWFTTADMGSRANNQNLVIAGRSDGMLKTTEGDFLAPSSIVMLVMENNHIRDAIVVNDMSAGASDSYSLFVEADGDSALLGAEIKGKISQVFGRSALPRQIKTLGVFPRVAQGKPDMTKLRMMTEAQNRDGDFPVF